MIRPESQGSGIVLDALVRKVHRHLGSDYGARPDELLKRLRLLALEQDIDNPAGWLAELAASEWDDGRIQSLTPALTVGETYFRRDPDVFDWLAYEFLAPLLMRRRQEGSRHLRVWSAGCCTGEEAYSLLFLLDDLLGAERTRWNLELIASDINASFLNVAEQGRYGRNALRHNDELFTTRFFQAEGRGWRVKPAWRGRIRFVRYNLASGALPNPSQGFAGLDLILCRNVLMYFSPEQATKALEGLLRCLSDDGLLLLSAVEAGIATQAGLRGRWAASNYALVRQQASSPRAEATYDAPTPRRRAPVAPHIPVPRSEPERQPLAAPAQSERHWEQACAAYAGGHYDQARQHLLGYLSLPSLGVAEKSRACQLMARCWADQQQAVEAENWLQRALSLEPDSATCYWLLALLAHQNGSTKAARQALQKALYLDPDFILGHFLQARLMREAGNPAAADKALQVCLELLVRLPEDVPVPHGDGMSGGQLRRLCEQLREEQGRGQPR
ncbi:CheR family methyltransferase [Pseudomonas indica]|uniref:CheR family methyltransferase n=1 Tax=Pseudomonas indica TaxID=137658 RepID=UPI000BD96AD5|nr:CheR family methyltransferase [Pseudomonas indica]PAU54600.1 hypothetical protein BZL42_20695 [Pseudomonas indica]